MKTLILALGAAALCTAGALADADTHTPVTITGCVHAGTSPDTYVLLDVKDVTDGKPESIIYWLSSTKGLKEQVGHEVEVHGTYSVDRDLGKTATMKIETDAKTGEPKVELENGAKKVETKDVPGAVGTSGTLPTEIKRLYRRLEVQSIRPIAERCVAP